MSRITACNFSEIGSRRAHWLRIAAYPGPHQAKRIERDWDVSQATAKRWLAGERPSRDQLERELLRWGKLYADFVFAPGYATAPAEGRVAAPSLRLVPIEPAHRAAAGDRASSPPALREQRRA